MSDDVPESQPPRPRGAFQFSLSGLFLTMTLAGVLFGTLAGMLRIGSDRLPPVVYFIAALAAPATVVVMLGIYRAVLRWWNHSRRYD